MSLWRQSAFDWGLSVKHGLEHLGRWQTVQTQVRRRILNYRKLRVKWNNCKSPCRTILSAYTQEQSTQQCCPRFDFYFWWNSYLPILAWRPIKGTLANSVDPDQNAASDQSLHCLHWIQEFQRNMLITIITRHPFYWKSVCPKIWDRRVHSA